jgi:ABC-2 type transport system permease protein/oleandomycin transport system permease protein
MATATTTLDSSDSGAPASSLVIQERSKLSWAVADGLAVTWRNLISFTRIPDAMFFSSIQPVMFVLLFRYVFGGAISVPGGRYVDYLMPGIFVQTIAFGAIGTAVGLADDMSKGLIERFRSLPMARSAVLFGRTTADLVRTVWVIALMTGVGYLVGFRVHTNVLAYLGGVGVLLLFAYAVCWGFATIGLTASSGETAQLMVFPVLMPLTFASGAFVPVQSMPGWLQVFARNQPVNQVVNAARALMEGGPTTSPVVKSVLWSLGLLAILVPLAVARYRKVA